MARREIYETFFCPKSLVAFSCRLYLCAEIDQPASPMDKADFIFDMLFFGYLVFVYLCRGGWVAMDLLDLGTLVVAGILMTVTALKTFVYLEHSSRRLTIPALVVIVISFILAFALPIVYPMY